MFIIIVIVYVLYVYVCAVCRDRYKYGGPVLVGVSS